MFKKKRLQVKKERKCNLAPTAPPEKGAIMVQLQPTSGESITFTSLPFLPFSRVKQDGLNFFL